MKKIEHIKGVGKKMIAKIHEIIDTGGLKKLKEYTLCFLMMFAVVVYVVFRNLICAITWLLLFEPHLCGLGCLPGEAKCMLFRFALFFVGVADIRERP